MGIGQIVADKDAEQPTSETVSSHECPFLTLADCTLIARRSYELERSRLRRPPLQSSEFVASACGDSIAHFLGGGDDSAYIPDHGDCPVTARTLQGIARVRSGQAPA
jgi:hypothetical protein